MRPAFIVPARNKAKHVGRLAQSVLAQTYPCEIIFSDQGSKDGTREILREISKNYSGPHIVRAVDCPITQYRGMVGMNVHLNWLMGQTDADVILVSSADDYTDPTRVERTVSAYEEHKPSMVLTGVRFADPDLNEVGINLAPQADGWVSAVDCIKKKIGGSTSTSFTREFYSKVGPLPGVISSDIFLSFLATQDKGLYYLNDKLHYYLQHSDANNTGLEGAWRAAGDEKKLQIEELMHFQVSTAYYSILSVMDRNDWSDVEAKTALFEEILDRSASWVGVRQQMTLNGIPPIPLPA